MASFGILGQVLVANELVSSRLEDPFRKLGLTFGVFELLATIRSGRGTFSQAELARRLGISPPSLCEAVQTAQRKGFVRQVDSPTDRRSKRPVLTPAGESAISAALAEVRNLEADLVRRLGNRTAAGLGLGLDRLVDLLNSE